MTTVMGYPRQLSHVIPSSPYMWTRRSSMRSAILVTGSRGPLWVEQDALVCERLTEFYTPGDRFVVGDAKGVDALVRCWCLERFIPYEVFEADWAQYGKRAGPVRNGLMVARMLTLRNEGRALRCLAFPGPKSVGTYDCIRQADKYMQVWTWLT